jgi:hypothetical protein
MPVSRTRVHMKNRSLALVLVVLAAGCGAPVVPATPGQSTVPPPTATYGPTSPAPFPEPAAAEVDALLGRMAAAVLAGDRDGYLGFVDLSDPVFAIEHARWADDWSSRTPVSGYSLEVTDLELDGESATGLMTVQWAFDPNRISEPPRTTTFHARFTGGAGSWRYAGERWASTDVTHFVLRVAPGLEATVPDIADVLPGIYDDVTAEIGYEPRGTLEIKLYGDANALVANTLLSLPTIRGWNEPGEALKLVHDPQGPPLAPTIAHELTHFVGFDRAGTQRSRMPWWLDEGIATYVASTIEGPSVDRLAQVVAWEAEGELAPWDEMVVFEETPVELWEHVYPQGYAMAVFVTERFGADRRNDWLAAMATEMDIDEATTAELGLTFRELDTEFRGWLADQR